MACHCVLVAVSKDSDGCAGRARVCIQCDTALVCGGLYVHSSPTLAQDTSDLYSLISLHPWLQSGVRPNVQRSTFNVQAFIRRASSMADKTSWTKPLARMTYGDC